MSFRLNTKRGFWLLIGGGAVCLLILLFAWVLPARRAADQAQEKWQREATLFQALKQRAPNIPSVESLKDLQTYRAWMDDQAKLAERFFADRAGVLDSSLAGEGEVTPLAFKDAYAQEVFKQRRRLMQKRSVMAVPNIDQAFSSYPWMTKADLYPSPADYLSILRDYWARDYLYSTFLEAGVTAVRELSVGRMAPLEADFDGRMPVRMSLLLPPEKVTTVIESLLLVSPRVPRKPILTLDSLALQPDPASGNKWVALQLEGNILFLRRAGAAPKAEAPKP